MTDEEKKELIETLKQDIANRPRPAEFQRDFVREMMEATLEKLLGETPTQEN